MFQRRALARAGSIRVNAVAGSISLAGGVNGSARASTDSGRFGADALDLGNLSVLNSAVNGGGFFSELELRQRGAGDLTVAAGDIVRARNFADRRSGQCAGQRCRRRAWCKWWRRYAFWAQRGQRLGLNSCERHFCNGRWRQRGAPRRPLARC